MFEDTIVAVATPPGRGGIAILRLSGRDALAIGRACVRGGERLGETPNRAVVVDLADPVRPGEALDRGIATWFRGPKSYTGEDVVEIAIHGSPVIVDAGLVSLLAAGARPATPGEFTLRAFLNGRLDLTQAEAVRDLVNAQTGHQARLAQRQLRGELSLRLLPLKERLLSLIVQLESTVEFVEDDIEPEGRSALSLELSAAAADLAELTSSYRLGRLVADGFGVALVGRPNAGKSSLFNRLVRSERAIVTATPGTTRDLVSEPIDLDGIPVRLVDTAGLRETEDEVEKIGVGRTRSAIVDADVVVVVIDADGDTVETARTLLHETDGAARVVVINKVDLGDPEPMVVEAVEAFGMSPIGVSALTGLGIDDVRRGVVGVIGGGQALENSGLLVTNARHHDLLVRATEGLASASEALAAGFSEEIALVGLHESLSCLGEVTGETVIDDILGRIFSTFCIGK
jgi:tRNA modification GTPase